jgi:DNA polymerase (family 10)
MVGRECLLTNHDVAETLRLLADLLSIRGESIYKVSAYRVAADSIDGLPESLAAIRRAGDLEDIPGVGKEIAQTISDLLDTGTFPLLQQVESQFPRTVAGLLAVPGIGPKRARELYRELGIDSLDALRRAMAEGRLDNAPGFGPGVARRIADGLRAVESDDRRLPLGVARARGVALIQALRAMGKADAAPCTVRR